MRIITEKEFLAKKKSDTIVILGSGYSINKVTEEEWKKLMLFDSIGFNWSCKHDFEPTFFLIREQANLPIRWYRDETADILISRVNRYKKTCCIICDVSKHTRKAYKYKKDKRINKECIIVRDDHGRKHSCKLEKYFTRNPLIHGLVHGNCTMYNILHLITYLNYNRIIFVGVDLYDSRYFWLPKKKARHTIKKKNKDAKSVHAVANDIVKLVRRYKHFRPDVEMYVVNAKSLLVRKIPYVPIGEL